MKFKIYRPDYSQTVDDAFEYESRTFHDLKFVAERFAEVYHSDHDGWECSWPIEFHIADGDGKFLGVVEVERETRPEFVGRVKEKL